MPYSYRSFAPPPDQSGPLAPRFAGLGVVEAGSEEPYPLHRHRDFEVIIPERGAYRCQLNQVELHLDPGACLVVKPGDQHRDLLRAGGRHLGVWFRLGLEGDPADQPSLPLFADAVPAEQQVAACDLRPLAGELLAGAERPDAVAARLQEALLGVLFWRVVGALDPALLAPGFVARCAADSFPRRFRAVVERLAGTAPSPAAVGLALGLGERALRAACRAHLGASPARAIMDLRLERAALLLRSTGLSVAQIAERLGFANPFHFARAFRRRHATTPTAYRAG